MVQRKPRNGVPNAWWISGILVIGAIVGIGISWAWIRMRVAPAFMTSPQVIVVEKEVAVAKDSRLPVFPDKDPQYPLRNLSHVAEYQQLGVLKSMDGSEPIALPLFGRRMANRPDRWEYYTATDKQNMLRVPVAVEDRDCSEDVGCNEIYKGDPVMVPVYNKMFEAQLYKYAT